MPLIIKWHTPTTAVLIFLLLMLPSQPQHSEAASTNLKMLKINTDLTAGANPSSHANHDDVNDPRRVPLTAKEPPSPPSLLPTPPAETHICSREEHYVEQVKVPSMQPVRVRTSTWCLEFPPRCSNYKTEMREMIKIQHINKTRIIRFCCDGYEGNISINDTVCKPVCRGGCGRGHCQSPDVCSCEAGYTGMHCTQRCDHDHWGMQCKEHCKCQNGAVCDNKSGLCHCSAGWTGESCEQKCPAGSYGVACQQACQCANGRCHPQTGACETNTDEPNTSSMMETLNSTIVNITNNLDRIAKNIVNIASTVAPTKVILTDMLDVVPTPQPTLPEVIVIKQDEAQHTPKIIVHQPGAGLLGDLHGARGKSPEVIHVITSWQGNSTDAERKINLAGFGGVDINAAAASPSPTATEHDANLLTTILIILLIIMIAIAMSFLYVYRRYHWQKARIQAALAARSPDNQSPSALGDLHLGETGGKSHLKPLPDLPGITQMVRNKIEAGPEFYDSPSNNSSIKSPSLVGYDYVRKESIYSVVSPAKSRKGSPDSHLYDEIRYPTAHQHLQLQYHHPHPQLSSHHQQQYHTHQALPPPRFAHPHATNTFVPLQSHCDPNVMLPQPLLPPSQSLAAHINASHIPAIPSQDTNFLQVPSALKHRQVAHV